MKVYAALFSDRDIIQCNRPDMVFAASEADLFAKVLSSLKANIGGFCEMIMLDDAAIDRFATIDEINEYLVDIVSVDGNELYIYTWEEEV